MYVPHTKNAKTTNLVFYLIYFSALAIHRFSFLNSIFFAFNRLGFFSGENKIIIIYFTGLHSFSIIMGYMEM